jgi:hypothetical protein
MTASSTPRDRRNLAGVASAIALAAFVAVACTGAAAEPSPSPSAPPVVSPSPDPSVEPSPQPSPDPSEAPQDLVVDLDTLARHDVSVVIDDQIDVVAGASSGKPGDGMSVRWFDAIVASLDDRTIAVTWVGLPVDELVGLQVTEYEGGIRLHFDESNPPLYSDAVGFDRVLVLEFGEPVGPDDVAVTFEGGPENEG